MISSYGFEKYRCPTSPMPAGRNLRVAIPMPNEELSSGPDENHPETGIKQAHARREAASRSS